MVDLSQYNVVGYDNFREVVARFTKTGIYGGDTETMGLRVHHGDRLFSLILSDEEDGFYFNFQKYTDLDENFILDRKLIPLLVPVFANPLTKWYFHNAKYDLHILANDGISVDGEIHCTQAQGLVVYNEHQFYTLSAEAGRIGESKDDAVENYIKAHPELVRKVEVPGKKRRDVIKDYTRVPPSIIIPYGIQDARVCRKIGENQTATILKLASDFPPNLPSIRNVYENEKKLTKTTFNMERRGLRIDLEFTKRGAEFEAERIRAAEREFKGLTGEDYKQSPLLMCRVFEDQKDRWQYTDKGNPSFESDILKKFDSPVARAVLQLRGSKAKMDFFTGFLWHVDKNGFIHPKLNQDGAGHGRFSSSEPNCQNLKNNDEDDEDSPKMSAEEAYFQVRRAFLPHDGFYAFSLDYAQVEYRLALDVAAEMKVIELIIKEGLDVHSATAQLTGLSRKIAKNLNFGLLYGQGEELTAAVIGCSRMQARGYRETLAESLPNVARYNWNIMKVAKTRGYIFNWFGRRCHFPNRELSYKALNYAMAGGAADVVKIGLNRIEEYLRGRKSFLNWNVHDENWIQVHPNEMGVVAEVKHLMETAYPHRFLPLECGVEWTDKSMGDLVEWDGKALAS